MRESVELLSEECAMVRASYARGLDPHLYDHAARRRPLEIYLQKPPLFPQTAV